MVKWQGRQGSSNIEDRRGQAGGGVGGGFRGSNPFGTGGGGFRLPSGRSGGGMGGIAIVIIFVVIAMAFGINPLSILTGDSPTNVPFQQTIPPDDASQDQLANFVGVVVKDTEDYWGSYFQAQGQTYVPPKVVLYTNQTESGCGVADSASGPFYCPEDQKVYLDLAFYDQLHRDLGAPGDFAQAYVVAHEVGHHVQQLTGVLPEFNRARQNMSQDEANAASVKVELQADCYAGTWAKGEFEQGFLDTGDLDEAINAANRIGDDRLTGGRVPKSQFTHGTSAQRMKWFRQGYDGGDPSQCDTSRP